MLSSSTYTTVRPDAASDTIKKNNISRGIKEFVRVVMMSSCSGTILSIFCDLREIQRRYWRLYLGIKIYRQSIGLSLVLMLSTVFCGTLWPYFMHQSLICWTWIPVFYALTKIHKPNPVGRPIISGCDSPTERISSFVDYLLQPIAKVQESYLKKDTTNFLNFIEKMKVAKGTMLVSMDVTKPIY